MTIDDALAVLNGIPEYDWLTKSGQQFFTSGEVADATHVSQNTVTTWKDQVTGATDYGGKLGVRFPRSGLIVFFAERIKGIRTA